MAKRRSKGGGPPDLKPYLRGDGPVPPDGMDELTLELVRDAMNDLSPLHQRFIELDIVFEVPAAQLEIEMGLAPGSFQALKREVMSALRDILRKKRQ